MNKLFLAILVVSTIAITGCSKSAQNDSQPLTVQSNKTTQYSNASQPSLNPHKSTDQDWPIKQYTLYGNTKKWQIMVDLDQVTVEGSELPNGKLHVERLAYAKGVEFTGQLHGQELGLNIRGEACKDADNTEMEFTATVYYGNKTFKGCAVRGITQ